MRIMRRCSFREFEISPRINWLEEGCRVPEVSLVKNTVRGIVNQTKHSVMLSKRILLKNRTELTLILCKFEIDLS